MYLGPKAPITGPPISPTNDSIMKSFDVSGDNYTNKGENNEEEKKETTPSEKNNENEE